MNLLLVMSTGIGLDDWLKQGIFDRELMFYEKLKNLSVNVTVFSQKKVSALARKKITEKGISVIDGSSIFEILRRLPQLLNIDIVKTNQASAGPTALKLSRILRAKFVYRFGYSPYLNGDNDSKERKYINAADLVITTTEYLKEYAGCPYKTYIIPNWVDTDLFRPMPDVDKVYDVIYVGRESPEKNLPRLRDIVEEGKFSAAFIKQSENRNIPYLINQSKCLCLLSFHEGHPKVLLESMACGVPVVATKTEGAKSIVFDGEDGFLVDQNRANHLFIRVIDKAILNRGYLGKNGRLKALKYDINIIARQEYKLYLDLLCGSGTSNIIARYS